MPTRTFGTLHLDVVSGLPEVDSVSEVCLVVDRTTGFLFAFELPVECGAREMANRFVRHVLPFTMIPDSVITDEDSKFLGEFLRTLRSTLRIDHSIVSPGHHEANGVVERSVRTLKEYFRTFCNEHADDWRTLLTGFVMTHNTMFNARTGCTPHRLVTGVDGSIGTMVNRLGASEDILSIRAETFERLVDKVPEYQWKRIEVQGRTPEIVFAPGDLILVSRDARVDGELATVPEKLRPRWAGPYEVVGQTGSTVSYQKRGNETGRIVLSVHVTDAKEFRLPIQFEMQPQPGKEESALPLVVEEVRVIKPFWTEDGKIG